MNFFNNITLELRFFRHETGEKFGKSRGGEAVITHKCVKVNFCRLFSQRRDATHKCNAETQRRGDAEFKAFSFRPLRSPRLCDKSG